MWYLSQQNWWAIELQALRQVDLHNSIWEPHCYYSNLGYVKYIFRDGALWENWLFDQNLLQILKDSTWSSSWALIFLESFKSLSVGWNIFSLLPEGPYQTWLYWRVSIGRSWFYSFHHSWLDFNWSLLTVYVFWTQRKTTKWLWSWTWVGVLSVNVFKSQMKSTLGAMRYFCNCVQTLFFVRIVSRHWGHDCCRLSVIVYRMTPHGPGHCIWVLYKR